MMTAASAPRAPTTSDSGAIVEGVLYLAPGFLALKIFYMFGAQRPRSEWEWAAWSVITSIPINAIALLARKVVSPAPAPPDAMEIAFRLLVGVAVGFLLVTAWAFLRKSNFRFTKWLLLRVTDSAWDQALEDIGTYRRIAELHMSDGTVYSGTIRYAGREDAQAREWIYLVYPEVYDTEVGAFRESKMTQGILVHRDEIRRIRVLFSEDEHHQADRIVTDPQSGT